MPPNKDHVNPEKCTKDCSTEISVDPSLKWRDFNQKHKRSDGSEIPSCIFSSTMENDNRNMTVNSSLKIAAFDWDWTLIKTVDGRLFDDSESTAEVTWLYDCIPHKLRQLYKDGFTIAIFSNQPGIEKRTTTIEEVKQRIDDVINSLGVPVNVFISTGYNACRKPSPDMWKIFLEHFTSSVSQVDMKESFFVGDSAGRLADWSPGKPADFHCGDRQFAANVGIDFHTPEEFFLQEDSAPFQWEKV
ncbi:unnamed protein product [Owenia fusiformis]|uniref:Uncharacterized protein n=1 Tax=Owenia fusiformis TaxID=6347 RepID=A0A8J1U5W1_OWEFU|nr:unnamed protein product [Owenia fusiformis]